MPKNLPSGPFPLQDGWIIALRAADGRFVSRTNDAKIGGKNYLEVAKSRMDVSCHLTILALGDQQIALRADNGHYVCCVKKAVTSLLQTEEGDVFSRTQETFFWIMLQACSLEQASRWVPLQIGPDQVAFQADNGLFLGYKTSYCFDRRLPLFLADPQDDHEFQTSFGLRLPKKARQKPSNIAASDTRDHLSLLRSIPPWRSATRWFDQGDFDDTLVVLNTHLFVNAFLVQAGDIVDGIQALYSEKGVSLTPPHGNLSASPARIELEQGDRWSEISGFFGEWFGGNYVLQLTFRSRQGKVSGPFGSMNYAHNIQPFHLVIQSDEKIVALSGVVSTGDNGKNHHLGALGLILCKDE